MGRRLHIGLIEEIVLENGVSVLAKVDTGADSSSIDQELAKDLGEKEIISHKIIRSALGRHKRPTIKVGIEVLGKHFNENFTVSDRSAMRYKVLIGNDILKKERFLVDPCK